MNLFNLLSNNNVLRTTELKRNLRNRRNMVSYFRSQADLKSAWFNCKNGEYLFFISFLAGIDNIYLRRFFLQSAKLCHPSNDTVNLFNEGISILDDYLNNKISIKELDIYNNKLSMISFAAWNKAEFKIASALQVLECAISYNKHNHDNRYFIIPTVDLFFDTLKYNHQVYFKSKSKKNVLLKCANIIRDILSFETIENSPMVLSYNKNKPYHTFIKALEYNKIIFDYNIPSLYDWNEMYVYLDKFLEDGTQLWPKPLNIKTLSFGKMIFTDQ